MVVLCHWENFFGDDLDKPKVLRGEKRKIHVPDRAYHPAGASRNRHAQAVQRDCPASC
jgi:hypothetical protein